MRKTTAFVFALTFLVLMADSSAQGPAVDWKKGQAEILQHYRALVQIDSVYGSETRVVEYLKRALDAEGIPSKTLRWIRIERTWWQGSKETGVNGRY